MENHFLPSIAEASACAWRCRADLEADRVLLPLPLTPLGLWLSPQPCS